MLLHHVTLTQTSFEVHQAEVWRVAYLVYGFLTPWEFLLAGRGLTAASLHPQELEATTGRYNVSEAFLWLVGVLLQSGIFSLTLQVPCTLLG